MNTNNDTEETKKLKELFYTAEKENIELAFTVALSTDNQQFLDFYQEWKKIYAFYQQHHAWGWAHFNHLSELLAAVKENGFSLSNLGIKNLPDYFLAAAEICESVSLGFNNLFRIPACLRKFNRLKRLNLGDTCLQVLPNWLFKFQNLEYLYLDFNFITHLSEDIQRLQNLKEFYFIQNEICALPPTLSALPDLQILAYGVQQMNTEAITFPAVILACQNLRNLNLNSLYLEEIPAEIANLIHLQELHICNCTVKKPIFGLEKLPNLCSLSLTGQHFKTIPESVFACKGLIELNLSGTQIDKIPAEISQLPNLEKLYLQDTPINSNSFEFWESQLRRWLPKVEVEWGFF